MALEDAMPDSTKELLTAQHAAVLRELNLIHENVRNDLGEIKSDMGAMRSRQDQHAADDNTRFGNLENGIGILKWAYGVGLIIVGAIYALLQR